VCVCVCVWIIIDKRNYYEQSALYQAFRCIQVCMCIYICIMCVCVSVCVIIGKRNYYEQSEQHWTFLSRVLTYSVTLATH
jgi:hypothetical protein